MEKEEFAILKSDIENQVKEIEKIYEKINERKIGINKDEIKLESLAYQLHNLYCAYEDLFKIVANFFENAIENRKKYHKELLVRMSIEIEGIRPNLISKEAFILLDSLRSFRHFYRHAYSSALDYRKVKTILEDALKLKSIYQKDIINFLKNIEQVIEKEEVN